MTDTNSLFLQPKDLDLADLYYCHWQSVLAGLQEVKSEILEQGLSSDIQIMNIDDFSDIKEIPINDFLLLRGFHADFDDDTFYVTFNIGVSTHKDSNNHRLAKLISYVYHRYMPGRAQYVVDMKGNKKATMTFTDQGTLQPISKAELRSIQYITIIATSTSVAAS